MTLLSTHNGGHARLVVEERLLAEACASTQLRNRNLFAAWVDDEDVDEAAQDDVQGVADVARREHALLLAHGGVRQDATEVLLGRPGQHRDEGHRLHSHGEQPDLVGRPVLRLLAADGLDPRGPVLLAQQELDVMVTDELPVVSLREAEDLRVDGCLGPGGARGVVEQVHFAKAGTLGQVDVAASFARRSCDVMVANLPTPDHVPLGGGVAFCEHNIVFIQLLHSNILAARFHSL
mmetsp:Transcript_23364/g.54589  ORF Transcript_23364/g.54589 Transcript_23364/m.54589 type:complete len:235 (-) Transcript_23364:1169-1873(-)